MKKLLLILVLAIMSRSVMAEWVRVNYDSGNSSTTYVNSFTIEKFDRTVKMWSLVDYEKAQERAFLPLYLSINRQIIHLYLHQKFQTRGKIHEMW